MKVATLPMSTEELDELEVECDTGKTGPALKDWRMRVKMVRDRLAYEKANPNVRRLWDKDGNPIFFGH